MQEAIKQIDLNFSQHATRVVGQTPGMLAQISEHLSIANSGLSCDTFNIIHIHGGERTKINELERTVSYFVESNLDYCIWVNSENLTPEIEYYFSSNGILRQNTEVGMVLDLEKYSVIQSEKHHNISIVDSRESIEKYADVIANCWDPPDQNVITYYGTTTPCYLESENITLLIYQDEDKPVSTIEMFEDSEGTIGFYGLATLSDFQGKGIGSSMLTFALNKAKKNGNKKAILQATEDGIGIYKKYGFVPHTTYHEFA